MNGRLGRYASIFGLSLCQMLFAAPQSEKIKPAGYAVASAHPLATEAGLAILAQGGNAFDAAIAVSAALAVVEPYHSGLGGGGFWLLHVAKDDKNLFLDARERAPMAAKPDMYLDKHGKVIPNLSLTGPLAAAIPGEAAALDYMARHYGRLPLSQSLAPAIRLAEEGFIVDQQFNYFSTMGDRLSQLQRFPATASVFLNHNQPYLPGQRLRQPDLAKTLRLLAAKGRSGFYEGKVAKQLVNAVRKAGGIWTLEDLKAYQVVLRQPLEGHFHQMTVVTAPPPSAGGVALLTMLNILSAYPLSSYTHVQWVHYLVEAMRLAYWQRVEFIGDPDYVTVPVADLLGAKNAAYLRSFIKADRATPSRDLPTTQSHPAPLGNTSHFSILDTEGNLVAVTQTVNYIFGSCFLAEGTGVLLNDEMDDFSAKPGVKNVFGLVGSDKNAIRPGRRPVSSMTPTFLLSPDRLAVFGTPGGSRIPTMVLLATMAFDQGEGAISMVSKMRFHHQYLPDWLQFEPDTFNADMQAGLKKMGYHLVALKDYYGDMQAITWDKTSQLITAASDPRHIGLAFVKNRHPAGYGLRY